MTTKVCRLCGQEKALTAFRAKPSNRDGHDTRCKPCEAAHRSQHYEKVGRARDLAKYGLTVEDYTNLLAHQGGVCAICGRRPRGKRLAVDHDHMTGVVRGLLCLNCNYRVIGQWGADPLRVLSAGINYLCTPPAHTLFDRPRRHVDAPPRRSLMDSTDTTSAGE